MSLKNLLMNGKNINHSKILWLFLLMFMKGGSFLIQPIKIRKEMRENELEYYSKIANWDFSSIKRETDDYN